jgi:hypothetical protein
MSAHNKSPRRLLPLALQTVSWIFLAPGFFLVGKSALEIAVVQHVTANSLSWSSAGLLLLLVGSLTNSCRKEFKLCPSNAIHPKG